MLNKIDEDLNSDSDSDCESESDKEMTNISEELKKIKEYQQKINLNIEDYDSHYNLIKSYRLCGDKNGAKTARESMNEHFPLSPEMWLEWIEDEKENIDENGDKSIIYRLLRRAIEDYRSVEIWCEFCQFSLGYFIEKNEIRAIFEEAVSQVGSNFIDGNLIWEIWMIYERDILLANLEGEKLIEQKDKVYKLYLRMLSLPLSGNKNVYEDFIERNKIWKFSDDEIKRKYEFSSRMIEGFRHFEDDLINAQVEYVYQKKNNTEDKSKEEIWIEYLQFAEENSLKKHISEHKESNIFHNKGAVINLYERAITSICLSQSIWTCYLSYLSNNFGTDQDRILVASRRAVLNNKSSLELRLLLVRNMELFDCPVDEIRKKFAETLRSSLSDPNPFLPLWQSYLDFERRQISRNDSNDMTIIRGLFESLIALDTYLNYDPYCVLIKYWAYIEGRYGSNIEKTRELWAIIRKSLGTSNTALWLENLDFERRFGDFEHCKRLMSNAVNSFTDYPDYLFERVLRWVSEDGDIASYLMFVKKIEIQKKRIIDRKLKETESITQEIADRKLKRANDDKKSNATQAKKQKVTERVKESANTTKHLDVDKSKIVYSEDKCVFVSNLSFKVTDKDLEEMFGKSGELEDIRLSRLENGKSRGFAYIQYKDKASVEEALKLEHTVLMERPMFVNRCDPNKRHSFNYAVGEAENNKLFIKNLPKTTSKQALEEIYSKYGSLKDVRLVSLRNGISKGIAYVEFFDENTASKALVGTDGIMIGDKIIEVFISKTPQKNVNAAEESLTKPDIFLVPRALHKVPPSTQKKQIHQSRVGSTTTEVSSVKKSNDDFRKFLK